MYIFSKKLINFFTTYYNEKLEEILLDWKKKYMTPQLKI